MGDVTHHVQGVVLKALESFPGAVLDRERLAEHIAKELSDLKGIGGDMYIVEYAEKTPLGKVKYTRELYLDFPDWLREEIDRRGLKP